MKTMLGGLADGRAPPTPARVANPIIPAAAPRRSSRRVIRSLCANTIAPPLRGRNLIYARRALRPAQHQAVDAATHIPEVGLVPALQFGNGASRVANLTKGLAHGGPLNVAISEVHPLVAIFLALEVFQVDFGNALPQRTNPVLRIAVEQHVANVEPRLNPRTLELADIRSHLQRTQQKLVPYFFDGDHNF